MKATGLYTERSIDIESNKAVYREDNGHRRQQGCTYIERSIDIEGKWTFKAAGLYSMVYSVYREVNIHWADSFL